MAERRTGKEERNEERNPKGERRKEEAKVKRKKVEDLIL